MEERRDSRVRGEVAVHSYDRPGFERKDERTEGFTFCLTGGRGILGILLLFLRFARVRIAVALVLQLRASLEKLQNQGIRPSSHFASTDNLIHAIGEAGVDSSHFHPGCCGGVDDGGKILPVKKVGGQQNLRWRSRGSGSGSGSHGGSATVRLRSRGNS